MNKIYFSISLLCIFLVSACVSKKKYQVSINERTLFQTENKRLKKVDQLNEELTKDLAICNNGIVEMDKLLRNLSDKYTDTRRAYNNLSSKYDELDNRKDKIIEYATDQRATIHERLIAQENELENKEKDLYALESILRDEALKQNLLLEEIAKREEKIEALNSSLISQSNVLQNLNNKLKTALIGFASTDLAVKQTQGKIYVSLSQNLLYQKGSASINSKGKDAIRKLALILIDNPDISINVEGHTDSDGTSEKNWDLSVERAVNIVKYLSVLKVEPERMQASGRGMYDPIDSNELEDGKKRNRRTEIILTPKLEDIYQVIERY